ncbi:MAG TPA: hypothetical protein VGQ00_04235 [Candidatus Norongarragalinales archaeon]|jgi:hypothetical protein|nr:hypothetical protein [Candidatus Norongarragalinales archaeon]
MTVNEQQRKRYERVIRAAQKRIWKIASSEQEPKFGFHYDIAGPPLATAVASTRKGKQRELLKKIATYTTYGDLESFKRQAPKKLAAAAEFGTRYGKEELEKILIELREHANFIATSSHDLHSSIIRQVQNDPSFKKGIERASKRPLGTDSYRDAANNSITNITLIPGNMLGAIQSKSTARSLLRGIEQYTKPAQRKTIMKFLESIHGTLGD